MSRSYSIVRIKIWSNANNFLHIRFKSRHYTTLEYCQNNIVKIGIKDRFQIVNINTI